MTKHDIINQIANEHLVEKIIYKFIVTKRDVDFVDDLVNDIYLSLLEKEDELITHLYETDALGFFIIRMVRNQLLSINSHYYNDYIKYTIKATELKDINQTTED